MGVARDPPARSQSIEELGTISARLKTQRFFLGKADQFLVKRGSPRFERIHLLLHARMIHALGYRIDDLRGGLRDLGQLKLPPSLVCKVCLPGRVVFALISVDEGCNDVGVKELVLQSTPQALFDPLSPDHSPVVARTFAAGRSTPIIILPGQC